MKIECIKEKLVEVVNKVEKVTGRNLTLPVLSCILFEAHNNILKLRATNLEVGIEVSFPVKVEREGTVAVPGTIVQTFLSHLYNDKSVTLEVIDGNLHIKTSHNSTIIKSLPHDDFPILPKVTGPKSSCVLKSSLFIKGLRSVSYSAAISSIKPELSSVYIYHEQDNLVFVSTDSFRLAEKKIKVKGLKDINHILIPSKNIPEIVKTLENIEVDVEISFDKNQISFLSGSLYVVSRIIDGVFPDYRQIIPKESTTEVIVLKHDLLGALKVSNVFSDKFNQISMRIDVPKKVCELKTKNSDIGEHTQMIDAVLKGESVDMHFNYRYINDCFQSIETDSVTLNFSGLNKPLIIRGVSDTSFMYLVMPMNK